MRGTPKHIRFVLLHTKGGDLSFMKLFEYAESHPQEILAVTDDGERIPYAQMNTLAKKLRELVGHRLVFVLCRNTPGSLLGYLGLLQSGGVSLLLDADIAPKLLQDLAERYRPAFCLMPEDLPEGCRIALREAWHRAFNAQAHRPGKAVSDPTLATFPDTVFSTGPGAFPLKEVLAVRDYRLVVFAPAGQDPPLAPELRLLLATSGSTGSSKLVRISAQNLDANAASIVEYLQITKNERPITVLPMQYSYGMSIINTHVMAGAPILLTNHTLMETDFWNRARKDKATSLCGVPYTFSMYSRLGLLQMDLPDLRTITQAGGKLPEEHHLQFARWCSKKGIRFCVMYGQTEASPRMGWLPPEKAIEKCGSMGIAIPGGRLDLLDENGNILPATPGDLPEEDGSVGPATRSRDLRGETAETDTGTRFLGPVGELVYTGPNVALGYAESAPDLIKGDEFCGVLHTGDMARRDADGYFYIVGRRSRFIKIVGKRISLDEVEKLLRSSFPELDFACTGKDDDLQIWLALPDRTAETEFAELTERISGFVSDMTGIPGKSMTVTLLQKIPRSSSGKILYAALPQ